MITDLYKIAFDSVGVVTLVVGSIAYLKSTSRKINETASNELITNLTNLRKTDKEEFDRRLKTLEDQHLEDAKALANMQGQIATYKDIPLDRLAKAMEALAIDSRANAVSNAQILETLKSSAVIAATDRDILTNPQTQTIAEQTVEHQTVKEIG